MDDRLPAVVPKAAPAGQVFPPLPPIGTETVPTASSEERIELPACGLLAPSTPSGPPTKEEIGGGADESDVTFHDLPEEEQPAEEASEEVAQPAATIHRTRFTARRLERAKDAPAPTESVAEACASREQLALEKPIPALARGGFGPAVVADDQLRDETAAALQAEAEAANGVSPPDEAAPVESHAYMAPKPVPGSAAPLTGTERGARRSSWADMGDEDLDVSVFITAQPGPAVFKPSIAEPSTTAPSEPADEAVRALSAAASTVQGEPAEERIVLSRNDCELFYTIT